MGGTVKAKTVPAARTRSRSGGPVDRALLRAESPKSASVTNGHTASGEASELVALVRAGAIFHNG
ncbi:hypothetical protein C8E89_14917 [Mycolicibacterium moriokaense]|uniref:Uncharacterized protein n=1 Tax=Mycolicibacterium moriokaense TaxID=39691 RepID=A0A318H6W4_9MYCO|nr:hypothetical protein C8E89_14917 [Mycolicibacterium moriokaense]